MVTVSYIERQRNLVERNIRVSTTTQVELRRPRMKPTVGFSGSKNTLEFDLSAQIDTGAGASFEPDAPEGSHLLQRTFRELAIRVDANTGSLWCYLQPIGSTCFTPGMISELVELHRLIRTLCSSTGAPLRYYVQCSRIPGIYNTGGDLGFLLDRIQDRDRESIRRYAYNCIEAVFQIATGFHSGMISVSLLEGDALGGGLEGAICCNYIIAERHVKLGFPEILFNSFPGMGAYSLLARRIGPGKTERMILNGKIYGAEELYDLGVIDLVVDTSAGRQAAEDFVGDSRKYGALSAIYRARQRVSPLTKEELRDVTDLWIETTMKLSPSDLRRIRHLKAAQARRLQRCSVVV